jgi:hypothetical protein
MPSSSAKKMKAYRQRKRAAGLRLVQRWLPDTRTPEFWAEARRQSLRVAQSPEEQEEIAFMEALQAEQTFPEDE